MSSNYGVKDIKTLEGIEAIRLRPGMYIGSTGPDGVRHITLEIISNAEDEYLNGHCTHCDIEVSEDDIISIYDDGRGVPFGKAEDGSETLENIFTKLHTGAKFDSSGKTGYNTSGGMNGVGAKATNALSEFFIVSSTRDDKTATMRFEKGQRVNYEVKSNPFTNGKTGTRVTFKPDVEIFKEGISLDYDALKRQIQELAFLSPGMEFSLTFKNKPEETIISKNGLTDYIDYLSKEKPLMTSKFYAESFEDRIGVKLALAYTSSFTDTYKLYTNNIPNSGGTHLTGFRTALTQAVNEYARENNLLKEKDTNLTGDDLKEGLILCLSFIMPDPVFSGQTKDNLTSSEARTVVQRLVSKEISIWLNTNPKDAKFIIEKALLARKARENARKAREATRGIKAQKSDRTIMPGVLSDCNSDNRKACEIFIVEGKSAAGTVKDARDRDIQAVLPVRGKILNTLKADLTKALGNAEIQSMIKSFGLQLSDKDVIVDESKLRYGKIIITADADVDGSHIRTLFLTFIWKFAPELIEKGYIYAAVPPLYKIVKGKNLFYLKDDVALAEYAKKNSGYELFRFKGLGEQDAEEMWESVMDPATRTLRQITMEDAESAAKVFMSLMGDSVVGRKEFIEKNADKANIDV